jgi:N-acetylmuramoyl-L-alanine amidase
MMVDLITRDPMLSDKIIRLAVKEARLSGIPASLTLAQYIVESASGTSELAVNANNCFGIKYTSGDGVPFYTKITKEFKNGGWISIPQNFRKYASIDDCFRDHSAFLHKSRYRPVWGLTDPEEACVTLMSCGYATDPRYHQLLLKAIRDHKLDQYDKEPYKMPLKIFLSPSSQEKNQYAFGNTVEEKVCNAITDRVAKGLIEHGALILRNSPGEGPSGHVAKSNAWGADLHICIHTNAGGGQGTEAFCYNAEAPSAVSTRLTKAIYKRLAEHTPTKDRGVKTNRTFYEIMHAMAPVGYFEIEFHDNKAGAQWIVNNLDLIARDFLEGTLETVGIPVHTPTILATVTASTLRIRRTPSINPLNIVGKYTAGARVAVLERKGDWARTSLGWVSAKYLA